MVIIDDDLAPPVTPELLARARAGDAPAFCLLVGPLQTRLLRQATALAGDLSLAEDLVSETLVEAWKSLPRYNETCRLSTWLYSILLHRHQKTMRRARSRPVVFASLPFFEVREASGIQDGLSSPEPTPAEAASRNEGFARLRRRIASKGLLPVRLGYG